MKRPSVVNLMLKAKLAERGMFVRDLAKMCGCTSGHVYNVVTGVRRSPRVIKVIEEFIGLPLFTNPQKMVLVATGKGGLKIHVPAIAAIQFTHNFKLLREIDPNGDLSVSDIVRALGATGDTPALAAVEDSATPGASE